MTPLRLEIVTPQALVFDGEVEMVTLPGEEGEFGVLYGHTPLLARTAEGVVEWIAQGKRRRLKVSPGFATVSEKGVSLFISDRKDPDATPACEELPAADAARLNL
ncbi:MAG: ATP synthase F1 subunit epsilon [Verrucomicrobium sp.]|nr:ATP synthase F1 subunit epsilon [Verrucomicrobium sp.]